MRIFPGSSAGAQQPISTRPLRRRLDRASSSVKYPAPVSQRGTRSDNAPGPAVISPSPTQSICNSVLADQPPVPGAVPFRSTKLKIGNAVFSTTSFSGETVREKPSGFVFDFHTYFNLDFSFFSTGFVFKKARGGKLAVVSPLTTRRLVHVTRYFSVPAGLGTGFGLSGTIRRMADPQRVLPGGLRRHERLHQPKVNQRHRALACEPNRGRAFARLRQGPAARFPAGAFPAAAWPSCFAFFSTSAQKAAQGHSAALYGRYVPFPPRN